MNIRQSVDPALLIPELEGKNLANLLSVPYFECSYVTGEGIKALFYEAASLLVNSDKFESYKEIEKDVDDGTHYPLFSPFTHSHTNLRHTSHGKNISEYIGRAFEFKFFRARNKSSFPKRN